MRLKELRKAKKLTQAEVANYVGITQSTYSYWESGKVKIDNFSIKKLAELFEVSIDYLLEVEIKTPTTEKQPNCISIFDNTGTRLDYELSAENTRLVTQLIEQISKKA
ncbi:MAG: helix-turn-helix transcriptional regulator [Clostridia bacterium]|nr:helix-turn-helix transcriptional regulator [Clostridia bacterium]